MSLLMKKVASRLEGYYHSSQRYPTQPKPLLQPTTITLTHWIPRSMFVFQDKPSLLYLLSPSFGQRWRGCVFGGITTTTIILLLLLSKQEHSSQDHRSHLCQPTTTITTTTITIFQISTKGLYHQNHSHRKNRRHPLLDCWTTMMIVVMIMSATTLMKFWNCRDYRRRNKSWVPSFDRRREKSSMDSDKPIK